MNSIRVTIGTLFQAPMGGMNFVEYFTLVNGGGKITARSLMDICTILLTRLEEQEQINAKNELQFNEIANILQKLLNEKANAKTPPESHPEGELTAKEKRINALAKAREAKRLKKEQAVVV